MPTWQQLRDAKFTEYEEAADGWGKVSDRADAARVRVDQEMAAPIHATQKGEAKNAAERDLTQLSRNYQYLHGECGLVRTTLNGLASELAGAQKKLRQALQDAEDLKFTVNEDGSVEYPRSTEVPLAPGCGVAEPGAPVSFLPGAGEANGDPNKGKAEDIAERIAQAVSSAHEIDTRYAKILRELKAPDGLAVTDDMLMDEAHDMGDVQKTVGTYLSKDSIPHGKSPADNKRWWDCLTQEQREEYQTLCPAEIGALDGIPSVVRDSSNRIVLDKTHAQVQRDFDKLGPEPPKTIFTAGGVIRNPEGDLDVGKSHVWAEAAHNDPVPLGGKAAGLGGYKWGVQTWSGTERPPSASPPPPSQFPSSRQDVRRQWTTTDTPPRRTSPPARRTDPVPDIPRWTWTRPATRRRPPPARPTR